MTELELFLSTIKQEVEENIENINKENLIKAASIILDSEKQGGRLHVTGIGKPGHVAGYIASLLSSTGTSAYELHGTEAVHGSSGQVKPGDVVIAISNSGETSELKATVETLIRNGAHVISCTGNENSWLSKHSEVCLVAHVTQEGGPLNKAPRASILSEILVLQSLSILLQENKKLDLNDYVKWHPGGSLGQSIREIQKEEK
ncbi:SIS domain-containing protein [Anaerorhabdus sp.]|uniref:SIS domain-containing protein n=1 Tax=Anaerorhabdus sp. TaxID=1872524 RepID=UPI002FC723B9